MQQPSAQGIAALFRGNPAPLQQRIQMEQQGKPGLPPDLQKLLALNIVTNEKDAVAKQQAMDQLNQMQGPQGKPPTVMQTVQEQARQKMQAQQVQAQQQQQAMQAMMQQAGPGPVPEGTPQPQAQPQGIDELPVEFSMAEGGIIAFEKGGRGEYETPYDRMNRKNRGELTEEERRDQELRDALISQIPTDGEPTVTGGERVRGSEVERNILNTLAALPGAGAAKATTVGRQALAGIASLLGMDKSSAPEGRATPQAAPQAAAPRDAMPISQRPGDVFVPRRRPEAPVSDLKALAAAQQAPRPAPAAPTPAPAPAAAPSAGIAQPNSVLADEAQALDVERMRADPQAAAANRELMYQSRNPAPDFTQRDAMIKQLQDERARHAGPQDSFGQLMEYLGQIAATPRGMSSFEAGAAGARGVRGLEEQRAQKRFDLGSKIIEQEQGKIDASRQYAKEVYGVGEKEYDRIFKEKYEAVGRVGTTEMERKKLAQQETLKMLELQQEMKRKEMDIEQRKAEEKGRMARDRVPLDQQVFPGYLKQAGGDVAKAYEMMKAAGVSSTAKPMTRDQASDNVAKKLEITNPNRKQVVADATQALRAAGIANPSFSQIEEHLIQEQMKGVSLTGPSGPTAQQTGKVVDFSSLPK